MPDIYDDWGFDGGNVEPNDVASCCSLLDILYTNEGLEPGHAEPFTDRVIHCLKNDRDKRQTAVFYEVKYLKELIPEMEKQGWIATKPQLRSRHGPYPIQQFVYMLKKPKATA